MAGLVLQTHEVYDFDNLPYPLEVGSQPLTDRETYDRHTHPQVGTLEYNNVVFPHIHVMDLRWKTKESLKLINKIPADTINFNFQLSGFNDVYYNDINKNVFIQKGQHYMVYQPDKTFHNIVEANSELEVLHISLDKDFFASCIGHNSKWAENIQYNLEKGNSFLSADKPLVITPHMQQLADAIVNDKKVVPMRNFMVQSRAMELIAAHINQVANNAGNNNDLSKNDEDKLYKVKAYLDQNFLEEFTLHQLSRKFLLNEFKLKRGFKLLFKMPVFAYIKNLRMNYATLLLKDSKTSIEEVAFILGYEYQQHFSIAYKKHTGINPSQVRS